MGRSVVGGSVNTFRTLAYQGPGDVFSGATGWWGLRAYTKAIADAGTQTVLRLRRDSDDAEADILVASSGGLGLTANSTGGSSDGLTISAFAGAANLFVTTLYDQAGSRNFVNVSGSSQPTFILSGLGSLPIITMTTSPYTFLRTTAGPGSNATSVSVVLKAIGTADQCPFCFGTTAGSENEQVRPNFSADQILLYAGNFFQATFIHDVWHTLNALYGTSAVANIDGTTSTGNSGGPFVWDQIAQINASFLTANANFTELGVWSAATSSTDRSNLTSNQQAYWEI